MSVVSGIIGAISSDDAAEAQVAGADRSTAAQLQLGREAIASSERATDKSIAAQREMFDISRADLAPWRTAGANALTQLQNRVAAGPPPAPGEFKFEETPGYQFRLKEGVNALDRSASARGRVDSGAQKKALIRYGQDYATGEYRTEEDRFWEKYDKELNRYYQILQPYFTMAGLGSSGANLSANLATSTGQGMGSAYTSGGNTQANALLNTGNQMGANALYAGTARASGYINQANALKGALSTALEGYSLYRGLNSANALGGATWGSAANTYGAGDMAAWFA